MNIKIQNILNEIVDDVKGKVVTESTTEQKILSENDWINLIGADLIDGLNQILPNATKEEAQQINETYNNLRTEFFNQTLTENKFTEGLAALKNYGGSILDKITGAGTAAKDLVSSDLHNIKYTPSNLKAIFSAWRGGDKAKLADELGNLKHNAASLGRAASIPAAGGVGLGINAALSDDNPIEQAKDDVVNYISAHPGIAGGALAAALASGAGALYLRKKLKEQRN